MIHYLNAVRSTLWHIPSTQPFEPSAAAAAAANSRSNLILFAINQGVTKMFETISIILRSLIVINIYIVITLLCVYTLRI